MIFGAVWNKFTFSSFNLNVELSKEKEDKFVEGGCILVRGRCVFPMGKDFINEIF